MYIANGDSPAVPVMDECGHHGQHYGLTKREYFAALAMQSYITGQLSWTDGSNGGYTPSHEEVAEEAVSYADALLKELDK